MASTLGTYVMLCVFVSVRANVSTIHKVKIVNVDAMCAVCALSKRQTISRILALHILLIYSPHIYTQNIKREKILMYSVGLFGIGTHLPPSCIIRVRI